MKRPELHLAEDVGAYVSYAKELEKYADELEGIVTRQHDLLVEVTGLLRTLLQLGIGDVLSDAIKVVNEYRTWRLKK